MAIQLTPQEMELVKSGKLDINNILEHRKTFPIQSIDQNEVDKVKEEIKLANTAYRDAIGRNKALYDELIANRAVKEQCRLRIAELRVQKKKLLGLE
ncbi:MAG: hypothetical protein WC471_02305 [Candidatus Woesearchaeota archaeon]